MSSFNWLHLTDLHFGQKGQTTLWPNIRAEFWNDLENLHKKSGPWHAVLFTGDLVQSGTAEEFAQLDEKILDPLWDRLAELGSNDPVLLTVPGNHDLIRPDFTKPKAALRQMVLENRFAEISSDFWGDPTCEYREIVDAAFSNYQTWSRKNSRTEVS